MLADAGKKPSALSRDYVYHYSNTPAPAVTVYGGKITTYRQLSMQAVNQLRKVFPNLPDSPSGSTPLPGATSDSMNFSEYQIYANKKYPWLNDATRKRYLETYGTRTEKILLNCEKISDLGICFSPTLYQVEVDYLLREEWASNCEDILWRRTKLGLTINAKGTKALANYLLQKVSEPA